MLLPLKDENPTTRRPWITIALIVANAAVFVVQSVDGEGLVLQGALVPSRVLGWEAGAQVTLFTSMFLHGGLVHLGGNLLYLWIFGNNIEDVLGHIPFLGFYLLAGLGGHAAHLLVNAGSTIPTIGASGAISGILGAYLVRFPHARVQSLFFFVFLVRWVSVPAVVVIGIWLVMQVLGGVDEFALPEQGGVAWFEHLGGFAVGVLVFRLRRWRRR
ncbi:MAG: rhomboid family intramembrane serine protease [bacterium]